MTMIIHHSVANFGHWECVICMKEKCPLYSLDNRKVSSQTLTANVKILQIIH